MNYNEYTLRVSKMSERWAIYRVAWLTKWS